MSAGTPETVIYDDDDFHWHFAAEEDGTLLLQVLRGKQIVAEIATRMGYPMRYEGTSQIQRLVIARDLMRAHG
jgi:hypothetical protein